MAYIGSYDKNIIDFLTNIKLSQKKQGDNGK